MTVLCISMLSLPGLLIFNAFQYFCNIVRVFLGFEIPPAQQYVRHQSQKLYTRTIKVKNRFQLKQLGSGSTTLFTTFTKLCSE